VPIRCALLVRCSLATYWLLLRRYSVAALFPNSSLTVLVCSSRRHWVVLLDSTSSLVCAPLSLGADAIRLLDPSLIARPVAMGPRSRLSQVQNVVAVATRAMGRLFVGQSAWFVVALKGVVVATIVWRFILFCAGMCGIVESRWFAGAFQSWMRSRFRSRLVLVPDFMQREARANYNSRLTD
jgi:hypothetical protein